jgi:Spy/CpxP family protein refolding chaperone
MPMNVRRTVFVAMAIAMGSSLAMAQGHPPKIDIAALLNVDAAKAQQVQSILDDGRSQMHSLREQGRPTDDASREKMHEAMESIHQDTDAKLAAILTPDQVAKLKAAMPRPHGPGRARGNPQ